jgi:hypothetical protein
MKVLTSLAAVMLLLACSRAEPPSQAPRQSDKASELRQYDPTMEALRDTSPPEPWMKSCYAVILPPGSPEKSMPESLELTLEPRERGYPHQAFAVRSSLSAEYSEQSSWCVKRDGTILVTHGNGFWGWQFKLRRSADGLVGEATSFTDGAAPPRTVNVVFKKHECQK